MLKQIKNHSFTAPIFLTILVVLSLIAFIPSTLAYNNYISDKTISPIAEVNKRNGFYAPFLVNLWPNLAVIALRKLLFIFMVLRETMLKPKKNLIEYNISYIPSDLPKF
jgi:hypothetical protein